jgi:hypothetical protein
VAAVEKNAPDFFSSGQYRIRSIELENDERSVVVYTAGTPPRPEPTPFRFGGRFRLKVRYECLLPEVPDISCGVAAAVNRRSDLEASMYLNTNYPHSDAEILTYEEADFRQFKGRYGLVEGEIAELQLAPGDYFLTVAILPNTPTHHDFYELHYLQYPITVLPGAHEVRGAFWPKVSVTHEFVD